MNFVLTGDDSIIINDIPLNNFANNDVGTLDLPNNLVEMATGKNGNTIYALDESGNNATLTVRILMGSADDKRLNGMIPATKEFANSILATGSVVKQVGDGQGNVNYKTYLLAGGIVQKKPNVSSNVNGDTEQGITTYQIIFANCTIGIL